MTHRESGDPVICCEMCGDADASFQPPGGLQKWYESSKSHRRLFMGEAQTLMLEMLDAMIAGDDDREIFTPESLDRTKQKLVAEGWRVLCNHCAVWGPPRRSRCSA